MCSKSVKKEGAVEQDADHDGHKDQRHHDGNDLIHPCIFGAGQTCVNEFAGIDLMTTL
jgi:hypothetical protein